MSAQIQKNFINSNNLCENESATNENEIIMNNTNYCDENEESIYENPIQVNSIISLTNCHNNECDSLESEIVGSSNDEDNNRDETNSNSYIQVINPLPNISEVVLTNESIFLPGITNSNNDCNNNSNIKQSDGLQVTNLAVKNSNNVTIGNKTIYSGPVTINQIISNSVNNAEENEYCDLSDQKGFSKLNIFKKPSFLKNFSKRSIILILTTITVAIATIIGVICGLLLRNEPEQWPIRLISRNEWGALPPKYELDPFVTEPYRALIAHTATQDCSTDSSCKYRVKFIQKLMMDHGFDDIGYNFLVGGNGQVYEGCGWDKIGIHTQGFNNNSICIAFIGNFNSIKPPEKQLKAAQWILNECVNAKKLTTDYKLYGVRQLYPSESPGYSLYEIIQKWPHWTDDIP